MHDLISRQAAIDAILHNQEVYSNNFGNDPIDKYTIAIIDNDAQTIAQLPSAQRWIPASERLPEKDGYYLTTTMYYQVHRDYWNGDNWDRTEMVIAWMPLPEPYKGEQE